MLSLAILRLSLQLLSAGKSFSALLVWCLSHRSAGVLVPARFSGPLQVRRFLFHLRSFFFFCLLPEATRRRRAFLLSLQQLWGILKDCLRSPSYLFVVWKNERLHRVAGRARPLGLQAAGREGLQHAADHLQGKKLKPTSSLVQMNPQPFFLPVRGI